MNAVRVGAGIPILFVHGNGVDHRLLLELDDAFDRGDWERIYVDLPGFGSTAALSNVGGLPELADWLDDAVTELLGDEPFALVANSLGGLLARDLTARRPDQVLGMALLASVVDPERRRVPSRTVLRHDDELLGQLASEDAEAYQELAVAQSPANWHRFERAALPGIRAADRTAMARLARTYRLAVAPEERGSGYDGPVLVVTGRQDHVVGHEDQLALTQQYRHATYAVLDEAGHNVHLDQPDIVRTLLREWSTRVAERRPWGPSR